MTYIKRIILDLVLFTVVIGLFMTEAYSYLPAPIQLVALKALLVSAGILHAHIVRKLIFPKVDWNHKELKGATLVSIVFYTIIPLCYAFGG